MCPRDLPNDTPLLLTLNFSHSWLVLAGVLIYSLVLAASLPESSFGSVVSIIMYVYGFIDSVMTFPLYYKQADIPVARYHLQIGSEG